MSDILREVDEAMRVEKMTRLWAEHGNTVIAAIVALILGTALSSGWNAWQHHQHLKKHFGSSGQFANRLASCLS
jgi:hypothetical protein